VERTLVRQGRKVVIEARDDDVAGFTSFEYRK
jgi:hypothetical protein